MVAWIAQDVTGPERRALTTLTARLVRLPAHHHSTLCLPPDMCQAVRTFHVSQEAAHDAGHYLRQPY